jgi:2-C-methyl-D-erythritol 4-phosphate cytidylyltransferase
LSTFALIPAAGSGTRIAGGDPKQYLPLAGRPMLWHAIRAVCVPPVATVFVVLAPEDKLFARQDWREFGSRMQPLFCGGASRRDSVYNGLVAARDLVGHDDWMLVHDAARPCLPKADLMKLIAECEHDDVGGLLAMPASDTVKIAASNEPRVAATPDRASVWLAQTPQMFRAGLLAQALQKASPGVTDEASAIEALGLRPRLVLGSRANLKVTYPEDLAIAEALLGMRR